MIDRDALMAREFPVVEHSYTAKDCTLFALGVGLGADPLAPADLKAVYERSEGFAPLPAMVNVLAYPGFWAMEPDTGLTWQKILHGEQSLTLHAPLPKEGTVLGKTHIVDIVDKGADKGALIYSERMISDKATGMDLATVASTVFARADGGFGGASGPLKPVHRLPERAPDTHHDFSTSPRNALIYRLSGDFNPLHADPQVAKGAGFERPILHGLCTMAVVSWSIPMALRDGDFTALSHMQQRFSAPVYPGETIRTEIWVDGDDVSFRASVLERDVVVLNNGLARLS
ncbi:MaoC/PaaZ C-terminal domain-containing protein [Hoeflea prorocentri]|uniref:MaoC/PaaZ C-terminal domain-containing protein n=1 Tax=Hoeflea prorocentri TaxID=1922333 RepID=A0A9X3UFB5_9HYPH|nr:MaoC/PaaZ C-terminal domain-containing protein [Hoeflea prorocentri]MCY6379702.1 MaoC/PaaZ C-terminal domain-containing protein [Hoeflea prorocentri]MDA5397502.1 MaoC/PaaZ C-terminal domain-containing protein [Hoeflea prorocentri]